MTVTQDNEIKGESQKILNIQELEHFDRKSREIIKKVVEYNERAMENGMVEYISEWMENVLKYNVLGGKMLRGLMVPMTYKTLMSEPSPENMQLAYALGWVLEILQAASLVADDMMDQSETRRGQPCWYKNPKVGSSALNDCFILEMAAFQVLHIYFEKETYYRKLCTALHEILALTVFGQGLDCHTENSGDILESYTMRRYDTIVKYKTSYYTTYMPVICGMIMTGKGDDEELVHQVEDIMLQIGHYFQVQDDYLDCFGDDKKTGKIGTDIQDNKCSWLFVKAVELCGPEELEILLENYGKKEATHVESVKKLYINIGIKTAYQEYEEETFQDITRKLKYLPEEMPKAMFNELLERLHKRAN